MSSTIQKIFNLWDLSFKFTSIKNTIRLYFLYLNLINYFNFFAVFIFLYLKRKLMNSNSVFLQSKKKLSCHYSSLRKCFLGIRSFIWQAKSSITCNISLMHWLFISETGSSWHKVTQNGILKCHYWKLQWNVRPSLNCMSNKSTGQRKQV